MIEPGTVWSIKFPRQDASGRMMLLRTCPVHIERKACALRTMPVCRRHRPKASLVARGAARGGGINTLQQSARWQKSLRHFHRNPLPEYNHAREYRISGHAHGGHVRTANFGQLNSAIARGDLAASQAAFTNLHEAVPPSGGGSKGPRRAGSRGRRPRSG